jgi:hypothetical protein
MCQGGHSCLVRLIARNEPDAEHRLAVVVDYVLPSVRLLVDGTPEAIGENGVGDVAVWHVHRTLVLILVKKSVDDTVVSIVNYIQGPIVVLPSPCDHTENAVLPAMDHVVPRWTPHDRFHLL